MSVAFFDLDHTLLDGDTNNLWVAYLAEQQLLADEALLRQKDFMQQYSREELDIHEYLSFHLSILAARPLDAWMPIRSAFIESIVEPRISRQALAVVDEHKRQGRRVAIVTATHSFLSGVIGDRLGLEVIAPVVEIVNGRITGQIIGPPSFREEKIGRVEQWLGVVLPTLAPGRSYFYSDSANDLPLLEAVSDPVTVNPDEKLGRVAMQRNWPQLIWRADSLADQIA